MIGFTIPGEPCAKGRPRFSRQGNFIKTYTPKKTVEYENLVRLSFMQNVNAEGPLEGELYVFISAFFPIPKSTSKKKRTLMCGLEIRPAKKPDCDNIAKIVLDSLNGLAYQDDKQVVSLTVNKFYSETPCVTVAIDKIRQ